MRDTSDDDESHDLGADEGSPAEVLRREHQVISLALRAMEREAVRIRHSRELDADTIARMVEFTRAFTDGCHHEKEAHLLFPLLQRLDQDTRQPIAVMEREHDGARRRMEAVAQALAAAREGDDVARRTIAANLAGYVSLMAGHIVREDALVLPLADEVLDEDDKHALMREFREIDRRLGGVEAHERYHSMARDLLRGEDGEAA